MCKCKTVWNHSRLVAPKEKLSVLSIFFHVLYIWRKDLKKDTKSFRSTRTGKILYAMLCYAMKVWVFSILNWYPTKILKTVTVLNFCSREKNHSGSIYILCSLIDIHTPGLYTSKQKSFFTSHVLGWPIR